MFSREKLLHPATAIAVVALFVSLGGVTYAAATIGTSQIKNGAVTGAKLRNGAVTGTKLHRGAVSVSKLARGAVRGDKLARDAVTSRELRDRSVSSGKILDAAVTASKLGLAAVGSTKLADAAVGGSKLADRGVAGSKLADQAVTADKLADGAVTAAKLAPGTAVSGRGQLLSARATVRSGVTQQAVLELPGLGTLVVGCDGGIPGAAFRNGPTGTADVVVATAEVGGRGDVVRDEVPAGELFAPQAADGAVQSSTWQVGLDSHLATAWVTLGTAAAGGCVATVQALVS